MSEESQSQGFSGSDDLVPSGQEKIENINFKAPVRVPSVTTSFDKTVLQKGGAIRTRTLIDKVYEYRLEIKFKALKSKQSELTKTVCC